MPTRDWLARHEQFVRRRDQGNIDLLFLGDSITEGWLGEGKATWDERYAPRRAANFGIGGDETQHVLWRITAGEELEGLAPKLVVLMIGTNNLGNAGHSADDTAAGVETLVRTLREKLPGSRLLLLGVFPRDARPGTAFRRDIDAINSRIAKLADGRHVTFLDVGHVFTEPDGTITPETMPDFLHLSAAAYRTWSDAMEPTLAKLLHA